MHRLYFRRAQDGNLTAAPLFMTHKIIINVFCVQLDFYKAVQILSSLGHSLSIITLLTSTIIILLFR